MIIYLYNEYSHFYFFKYYLFCVKFILKVIIYLLIIHFSWVQVCVRVGQTLVEPQRFRRHGHKDKAY